MELLLLVAVALMTPIAVVVLAVLLFDTRRRLSAAEAVIARLSAPAPVEVADEPVAVIRRRPPPFVPAPPPARPASTPPAPRRKLDLESLIGGRLPIWIGGIALVLAGFFLVRAAIDSGLMGPGVRVVLAAIFALAMVGASEVARRLPATREDARVGQVLAGAGVASAYGTLYLAAALYHLLTPIAAFVVLLGITGAGLALAIRQGPPTAVMALVGGFVAPLVAGYDAAGVAPLMVYLGLLVGALFVLAARRGWGWLAIAAALAGFGWTGFLTFALDGGDRPVVGVFVVGLALAASLALPKAGATRLALRIAPMALGLAQLFLLAPALDFSPLGWAFYLVLGAAAVAFAWREATMVVGALVAAILTSILLAIAPADGSTGVAALIATVIFGGPGLMRSREDRYWAALALIGIAGPIVTLHLGTPMLAPNAMWAVLELTAACIGAWLAWRHRDRIEGTDIGLVGGALVASGCGVLALIAVAGEGAGGVGLALAMLGLYIAGSRLNATALQSAAALPLFAAIPVAWRELGQFASGLAMSLPGEELIYPQLPRFADMMRMVAPPGVAALVVLRDTVGFGRWRKPAMVLGGTMFALAVYGALKQPLAIATAETFAAWGFIERAMITLVALGVGWGLATRGIARRVGDVLLIVGLARILWYDLILLSPVFSPQAVGAAPILNAAVLLPVVGAALCWTWPGGRARIPSLVLMLVAALALVRQAAHGDIITGPVGTGENWGYSAAMLAVALAWLWRGIVGGARDLRFAGLGLVLVVALKVFTIDVALDGILRVVSFLGIGVTLIAISWAYTRFLKRDRATSATLP